MELIGAIL
ncbi:rCG46929 [Rattus norvegicus]|uniref:RCG46929 n=1 Tax=Rattus norvegicus TaxID=10116 RepID=A6IWV8_RAT|nr:rCG46929 [Rattus norvegicus]